jgi:hypothetical protein
MLDLDTTCGKLNKLLTFNNKLFYFQDSGVGIIPIEDREVVSTNTGSATTIGTGGVMTRYDYITTKSGCSTAKGVVASFTRVYYVDSINKKICRIGDGIEYLSDVLGINSFTSSATYTDENVNTLFNHNFNEIWFNINNDCITFNEYTNTFVSFVFDTLFDTWAKCDKNIYTAVTTNNTLVQLDVDGTYKNCTLHLFINPDGVFTDRFDSITISSTVDANNTIMDKSFTKIGLSNNYQSSSLCNFYPPARKRMRQFIYNNIRDTSGNRFLDTYLKVILTFETSNNERLRISDIVTNYTTINNR